LTTQGVIHIKPENSPKPFFPIKTEPHIWVAASRLVEKVKEPDKWEKEMTQAHILTSRGSGLLST
jgi:hypothetical protein